ncbi:MAG TPA: VOC family protein [Bryobacteraceae bacterium]|jgi:catechol 2,3-dioxygenase-like lactoylglutathione lyase family enzyme|nr:VOC family protein [Bryobacteraceae bacterium]
MISGGNATVFVSNMDAAVRFYTEVLGLKLTNRFGDNWATVEAGKGLTIGLHPASPK